MYHISEDPQRTFGLMVWTGLFGEISDYFLFYLWTVLNGTTSD